MATGRQNCTIFSIRVHKINTTVSIKNKILAFYCTIVHDDKVNIHDFLQEKVNYFVSKYKKEDFKGISDYLLDCFLKDMLEKKDIKKYKEHLSRLEE